MSVPLTVVVPTIGRASLLEACAASILACDPGPAEVLFIDQSTGGKVAELAARFGARHVRSAKRGIAAGTNLGMLEASHRRVLVTHDDCVVAPDWVGIADVLMSEHPSAILTGRVLPPEGTGYVPSTVIGTEIHDYTGRITSGVLFPNNMALDRDTVLAAGGFDERPGLRLAAEDNDLCYRWLLAGGALRYEPSLVVWHCDWRTPEQLVRTHIAYAHGQGAFYAKHLRAGDRRILPLLWWDLRHGIAAKVLGTVRRTPRWSDPYREMVGSLILGIARNLPEANRLARAAHRGEP